MEHMDFQHTAKQLASLRRAAKAGQRVDDRDVWNTFVGMVSQTPSTAQDALALMVLARDLMQFPIAMVPPFDGIDNSSTETIAVHLVAEMLDKSIRALEHATGETAGTFTGDAPALN